MYVHLSALSFSPVAIQKHPQHPLRRNDPGHHWKHCSPTPYTDKRLPQQKPNKERGKRLHISSHVHEKQKLVEVKISRRCLIFFG